MINKFTGEEWFSINETQHDKDPIIQAAVAGFFKRMQEEGIKLTNGNRDSIVRSILRTLPGFPKVHYTEKDVLNHLPLPVDENLGTGVGRAGGPILTIGKGGKHYMPGDLKKEDNKKRIRKKVRKRLRRGGTYGMGDSHAGNGDD